MVGPALAGGSAGKAGLSPAPSWPAGRAGRDLAPINICLWNSTKTPPWACVLPCTCAQPPLILRVYCHLSPQTLAAAFASCQQQTPLLQIPVILFLVQHTSLLTHPVYLLSVRISLSFFHLSHRAENTE